MESMTGYAFIEKNNEQFSYSVEIKSLNSKYLETYINIPRIIRNEENGIQQVLKGYFERGKVELNVDIYDWTVSKQISLNAELIKKYYRELEAIRKSLKIEGRLDLDPVLRLEGVSQRERSIISGKSLKELFKTLEEACKKTLQMRKREGTATRTDIMNSLAEISRSADIIKTKSRGISENKVRELRERVERISQGKIDESRLYSEIAILADKIDINEELVRLGDHIAKFKSIAKENGQVGRKLDFLAQEMFREINTISSKSNSSEISHIVVDVKNNIDKIREQCRNVV
ncbi:MAG TPA: YicC family protein [Spirochaetota bacterium]|nr:YicC family protein [Spirochaetota bacterium]HRZ27165.1 YicC family protein [Spirochaetota bacterium]HSA16382.1 YicC family protein [Spirochaetota bacterium]